MLVWVVGEAVEVVVGFAECKCVEEDAVVGVEGHEMVVAVVGVEGHEMFVAANMRWITVKVRKIVRIVRR